MSERTLEGSASRGRVTSSDDFRVDRNVARNKRQMHTRVPVHACMGADHVRRAGAVTQLWKVGMSKIGYFFWHFMLLALLLLSLNNAQNYALFAGKCQKC